MKILIKADMEGTSGVLNFSDWCCYESAYYNEGKRLTTLEVNAAVEGFYEAGAKEVYVLDGHGRGCIDQLLLDERTLYIMGNSDFYKSLSFLKEEKFDALAFVGQHAKAGSEYAHLPHTGSFSIVDYKLNGISIGEYGRYVFSASQAGDTVPIFASGDRSFAREAVELVEGIVAVWVKRGFTKGAGDNCDTESYERRNSAALHMHPVQARRLIKEGAKKALDKYKKDKEGFKVPVIKASFRREVTYRKERNRPPYTLVSEHESDFFDMMEAPLIPFT